MKWLHLSDLHYNPSDEGVNTTLLRNGFPDYLRQIAAGEHIEHLFLTGDYRYAPRQNNKDKEIEYARQAADYIIKCAKIANIRPENIHLVPGNHDLERCAGKDKERLDSMKKSYSLNVGDFKKADVEFLLERFSFFEHLRKALKDNGVPDVWENTIHAYRIEKDFNIIYLNTCLFANDSADRGSLLIGTNELLKILQKVKDEGNGNPVFVLAHHALEMMESKEFDKIKRLFDSFPIKLYLCGDAHDFSCDKINEYIQITTGCMVNNGVEEETVFTIGEMLGKSEFKIFAHNGHHKYNTWNEYGHLNDEIKRRLSKKTNKVQQITYSNVFPPSNFFMGRDEEIAQIENTLKNMKKLTLLCSMGGLGKTEICRKLYEKYTQGVGCEFSKKIGWINFDRNLQKSVYNKFSDIKSKSITQEDYYDLVKERYFQDEELLLIIDNMEEISFEDQEDLHCAKCKILITSREKVERFHALNVQSMADDICLSLYRKHSKDILSTDECIMKIIKLADNHTLAIELLAKTQYTAHMTAEELYLELAERGFQLKNIKEHIEYFNEAHFIEHMEKVFDIADLKKKQYIDIMLKFSLLQENVGVSIQKIKELFGLDNFNDINKLIEKGWLLDNESSTLVLIHSVIAAVIRNKVKCTKKRVEVLVKNMSDEICLTPIDMYTDKLEMHMHAKKIVNHLLDMKLYIGEDSIKLIANTAVIYDSLGDYNVASKLYKEALNDTIINEDKNKSLKSGIYGFLALTYKNIGDYKKALKFYHEAIKLYEGCVNIIDNTIINLYNNLSMLYTDLSENQKAIDMCDVNIARCNRADNVDVLLLAGIYNCYVTAYDNLNLHEQALIYSDKSYEIVSELFKGKSHQIKLTTINNRATIYEGLGKYKEALDLYNQVLADKINILGEVHPSVANTHNNIAVVYNNMRLYNYAIEHNEKALNIRKQVYKPQHQLIANTCSNLALNYRGMKKYDQALIYNEQALEIRKEVFGESSIKVAESYNNMALIYHCMGCQSTALTLFKKVLTIKMNFYSEGDLSIGTTYNNLGLVYREMGDCENALTYHFKEIDITKKWYDYEHPMLSTSYYNVGLAYEQMEKYKEALSWYKEAYRLDVDTFGEDNANTKEDQSKIIFIQDKIL